MSRVESITPATPARAEPRSRAENAIHDHGIVDAVGCPRGRSDCSALSRIASPHFQSFMCCGETNVSPVPTDRLRLCVKSTHETGVDVLINLDERDAVHTASVLLAGLSAIGSMGLTAAPQPTEPAS